MSFALWNESGQRQDTQSSQNCLTRDFQPRSRPSAIVGYGGGLMLTDGALRSDDLTTIQLKPVVDDLVTQARGHFALQPFDLI